MGRWLVKQEPESYPFATFLEEGRTPWDGVRNYQARNNLAAMEEGDEVLYYHSGGERAVVGLARVVRAAYPDPGDAEGKWVVVDLEAVRPLGRALPLATIKADPILSSMVLVRQSRLSVMPVTDAEWRRLLELTGDWNSGN